MQFQIRRSVQPIMLACLMIASSIASTRQATPEETPSIAENIEATVKIHRMKYGKLSDRETGLLIERMCRLSVNFGSYSGGIDTTVFGLVMSFVTNNDAISEIYLFPWGMEGERTLCIVHLSDEDGERLFQNIKRVIPEKGHRGPTSVHFGQESYGNH